MVKVRIEGLPEEVETFTELLEKDEKYEFHIPHRLQAEEKQNISAKSAEKRARLQLIRR